MRLHIFNPEHDIALAHNNPYFTAPHTGRQLRADLGFLPALWAADGDWVLVDDVEAAHEHVRHLKNYAHKVVFVSTGDLKKFCSNASFCNDSSSSRPPISIEPWGWNVALCHQLKIVGIPSRYLPSEQTLQLIREMSGRQWAARNLIPMLPGMKEGTLSLPSIATSIEDLVKKYGDSTTTRVVLKAPWSSSGRGIRYVDGILGSSLQGWIRRIISQQGCVMMEPYYDNKVKDFAVEFYAHSDGHITYEGLSLFKTMNGAYAGNIIMTEKEKRQLISHCVSLPVLENIISAIIRIMEPHIHFIYTGPFGVDMMALQGGIIHPCVELNLRRTMGHVALAISPHQSAPQRLMRIAYTDRYHLHIHDTFENIINNSII